MTISNARAKIADLIARLGAARTATIPQQFRAQLDKMICTLDARIRKDIDAINEIEARWPADAARTADAEAQMLIGGLGKPMVIASLQQIEAQVAQIEAGISKVSSR